MAKQEEVKKLLDQIDAELEKRGIKIKDKRSKLAGMVEAVIDEAEQTEDTRETRTIIKEALEEIKGKLDGLETLDDVVAALERFKVEFPQSQKVEVTNLDRILKPFTAFPSEIGLKKPVWLTGLFSLNTIEQKLEEIAKKITGGETIKLPKDAKDAVPVRLSDGEDFYKASFEVFSQGGGGNVPKVHVGGGIQAVPVVNPDGTNISGGEGSGTAAYSDSGDTDKKGLVDSDRHVQTDVLSSALPSGAATSAKQDTAQTALDAIQTAVQTLDNVVAGNEAQVDIVGALPAGNNNIGDVDVTSVVPGTSATSLGKAEDASHNSGDTGVMMLAVRNDGGFTSLTGANGDYSPIAVDEFGTVNTNILGGSLTTVQQINTINDPVTVIGSRAHDSTDSGNPNKIGGYASAAAPTSVDADGDRVNAWFLRNGAQATVVTAAGALIGGDATNGLDTDVTRVIPGTSATHLGKAEDVGFSGGDTGVFALGVRNNTPNTATTNADADYSQISTDMVGGIRTALYETDFAVLGTNHVKKYYTNAGAVTDGIIWSPAAGKRWYVTDIFINVSAAATVTLEDDKAGGDEAVWKAELAANSGWSHRFGTPLFSGEDAADLLVTTSAGNVYITVTGYEI